MNLELKLKIIQVCGTQERLAYRAGISESKISKIVRGLYSPNKAEKGKIEKVLKTKIDVWLKQGYCLTE